MCSHHSKSQQLRDLTLRCHMMFSPWQFEMSVRSVATGTDQLNRSAHRPPKTGWSRLQTAIPVRKGSFEQGALSVLHFLNSTHPITVLPGPCLFQANVIPTDAVQPAIYHSFGRAKSLASGSLAHLHKFGWETLTPTLCGVEELPAAWHKSGWPPCQGVAWPLSPRDLRRNRGTSCAMDW